MKLKIDTIVSRFYVFLFRQEPGETAQRLIGNIFYNLWGVIGGTLVTFLFSIWAIRLMGPAEYGKANVVIGAAAFPITFVLFGLTNSAMRYLAREREARGEILGAILTNVFILAAVFLPLFWLGRNLVTAILRVDPGLYGWAIGYTAVLSGFYLTQAILQGLGEFRKLALITIGSAAAFSAVIAVSAGMLGIVTFGYYLAASMLRWGVAAVAALFLILPIIKKPSIRWMVETLHFGVYHVGMYIAGFFLFFSIDALMLNYFLDARAVGIYGAYYMTFNLFAGKVFQPIIDAFYPAASAIDDTALLFHRIKNGSQKLLPLVFVSATLITAVLFRLYGRNYQFRWGLAALMAFNIVLYVSSIFLSSLIGSRGIAGARFLLLSIAAAATVNVALNAVLIPRLGIAGVMLATTAASLMLFVDYFVWLKRNGATAAS